MDNQKNRASLVHQLATELLDAVATGEQVDPELLVQAEKFIQAHQLVVQLLYVGMVVDRISQLPHYFDALDAIIEDVDMRDLAEADAGTKLRAVGAINAAIKSKVEIINNMMASKDATGLLVANLRETFGETVNLFEEGGGKDLMTKIQEMTPEKRQRFLGGVISSLKTAMKESEDE